MHANPYFKNLPLDGTKGELFIIKAPELNLDVIVNTSVLYYHWATCSKWGYLQLKDKTNLVTEDGKQELIDRKKLLTVTLLSWSISQEFDQQ
jgi:hypothetical protein